jgi:hypothetical protein
MQLRALLGVTLITGALACERDARAQACCATSTSTIFPARLQDDERALLGIAVKGAGVFGSYDASGALHGQPAGVFEADFGQTMLATVRLLRTMQINFSVPFVETWRGASEITGFGGGVSDLSLAWRWDMLRAGHDRLVPGIAPTLSLTVPSGTPVELARDRLSTGATGMGSAQVAAGLALEELVDRTLLVLAGSANFHGARTVGNVHSQLGPDISATLGVSYTFQNALALGAALTVMDSFDTSEQGHDDPASSRALTQLAVSLAIPVRHTDVRVLASFFMVPPVPSIGRNEPATVGLSFTLLYGFKGACDCPTGVCPMKR